MIAAVSVAELLCCCTLYKMEVFLQFLGQAEVGNAFLLAVALLISSNTEELRRAQDTCPLEALNMRCYGVR